MRIGVGQDAALGDPDAGRGVASSAGSGVKVVVPGVKVGVGPGVVSGLGPDVDSGVGSPGVGQGSPSSMYRSFLFTIYNPQVQQTSTAKNNICIGQYLSIAFIINSISFIWH